MSEAYPCLPASAVAADDDDASRFDVTFAVTNGVVTVSEGALSFAPSPRFERLARLATLSAPERTRARQRLESVLRRDVVSTVEAQRELWKTLFEGPLLNRFPPELLESLRGFSGSWEDFVARAVELGGTDLATIAIEAFERWVPHVAAELALNTPLFLRDEDDPELRFDAGTGTVKFRVADPFAPLGPEQVTFPGIERARAERDGREVVRALAPLAGRLWRRDEIRQPIVELYAEMGVPMSPDDIVVSRAGTPKTIEVRRRRITRALLPAPREDDGARPCADASTDTILYILLPDRLFRDYLSDRCGVLKDFDGMKSLTLKDLGADIVEPFLNLVTLQTQQLQLQQLGFLLGKDDFPDGTVLKVIRPSVPEPSTDQTVVRSAAPVPNRQGVVTGDVTRPERQTDARLTESPPSGERRNYLAGGVEYRPGQGVRLLATYQRARLGPGDLSLRLGGDEELFGGASYFVDFVAFERLHRRLSLQITGSSDFEADRRLGGRASDERRSGGLARADLEPFRDRDGHLLRLFGQAQSAHVDVARRAARDLRQNLTTLDLGAFYQFDGREGRYARRARLEPRLRVGMGLTEGEPGFTGGALTGNVHQRLPGGFAADVSGRLGIVSRHTPVFEQESLGGEETVRGFRRDTAIGRLLWSLQSELWAPIPGIPELRPGMRRFVREHVNAAAFVDVGAVSDTTASRAGVRLGPGVGLRLTWSPVILKLDWAYGISPDEPGGDRGRVHFSVGTTLPF